MNIRFWIRHQFSWVKLTLSEEKPLKYNFYQLTDEGYESETTTAIVEDEYVYLHTDRYALDCDGPMSTEHTRRIPVTSLDRNVDHKDEPIHLKWETLKHREIDWQLVEAGY